MADFCGQSADAVSSRKTNSKSEVVLSFMAGHYARDVPLSSFFLRVCPKLLMFVTRCFCCWDNQQKQSQSASLCSVCCVSAPIFEYKYMVFEVRQ